MNQPIYEIPVNQGLRDQAAVPPPGAPVPPPGHTGIPANYGPPPGTTPGQPVNPFASAPPPTMAPPTGAPVPSAAPPMAAPHMPAPPAAAPGGPVLNFPPPVVSSEPSRHNPVSGADPDLMAALQKVLLNGASDLHVSVNAPPMIRVDGALETIPGVEPWARHKVMSALYSIMSEAQRERFEEKLELDFAFSLSPSARFRVNYYQQRGAIGGAFRLVPTEVKQLKDLGVPSAVAEFAKLPRGLVLVTGPTGSGKSTTLAALIDLVNRTRTDHIMTVEDPIEFVHGNQRSLVNQREVGQDTHTFAAALKHVLRQDPDVILIGELRDLETISVALTAAETGHLVFATLHTQDAPQTVDRIIDVFPPHQQGQVRAQLAAVLQGVVCQTLVKHASGRGRVVAMEIMFVTPAISNLIREGKTYQIPTSLQAGRSLGMQTLDQNLAELVNAGEITHKAALERVHDAEGFSRLVHRTESSNSGLGQTNIDFGDSFSGVVR